MVLFRETKHLLLANMSSSGTGTLPEELQTYWFAFILYSVKRLTLGSSESGLNLWQILRATKLNLVDFFKEFSQFILRVGPVLRNLYGADWENRLEAREMQANFVHLSLLSNSMQLFIMLGSSVMIATLIVPQMGGDNGDRARVIQTLTFMGGINTLHQNLFGTQLPTVMGSSFAFIIPVMSIINDFSDSVFTTEGESTATYFAIARLAGATPPPAHVLSRSMGLQGVGMLLEGIFGVAVGTSASVRTRTIHGHGHHVVQYCLKKFPKEGKQWNFARQV